MADKNHLKSSFGWIELENFNSNPSDTDSSKRGVAIVNGALKLWDGSSWSGSGKWASGDLSDGSSAGGVFAWQNPEDSKIIVDRVFVDITSAATDTSDSTMNVGTASDDSTNASDIMSAVSTQSAQLHDNIDEAASSVKLDANGGSTDYITGSEGTADVSGLAGKFYVHYRTVAKTHA